MRKNLSINCQIGSVVSVAEPVVVFDRLWQRRNRVRRIVKRRWRYIINTVARVFGARAMAVHRVDSAADRRLRPGDPVRVRSRKEIEATLNEWRMLKGCSFMEEMLPYCDTTQHVLKRVENFLDERDYLMKRTRGVVILDAVFCEGTKDYGRCDRTCFYFWREEWLERVDTSMEGARAVKR